MRDNLALFTSLEPSTVRTLNLVPGPLDCTLKCKEGTSNSKVVCMRNYFRSGPSAVALGEGTWYVPSDRTY